MYVTTVGNAAQVLHVVRNDAGDVVTSSVTGFTASLLDETQAAASSSLVTWSEPVTTGYVLVAVTPDAAGTWLLRFTNPTTSSDGTTYEYPVQCVANAAGVTPSGTWLTTLANLKEQLEVTGSTKDTYFGNVIARASRMIEDAADRYFVQATYTEDFDGGGSWLELRNGPIQSVTGVYSLSYDGSGVATTSVVSPSSYRLYNTASEGSKLPGRIKSDCWEFLEGNRYYRVVYSGGFATVPYDIEQLCLDVCCWLINHRKDAGVESRDIGSGAMSFRPMTELYEMIQRGVAHYRAVS